MDAHYSYINYLTHIYSYELIFDEGGKLEDLEKNPRGMRERDTLNKLCSNITWAHQGSHKWKASILHCSTTHASQEVRKYKHYMDHYFWHPEEFLC